MSDMTESRFKKLLAKEDRTLEEANFLIDKLFGFVAQQGAAIIDLRAKMVDHKDVIEGLSDNIQSLQPRDEELDNKFGLIGMTPPNLELN